MPLLGRALANLITRRTPPPEPPARPGAGERLATAEERARLLGPANLSRAA
jgi:hypothetical protein